MADKKRLPEAANGVAPSYKDDDSGGYEKLRGKNGAPYMMIVDGDGNPISSQKVDVDFPDNQSVSDADAKSELQEVKSQLKAVNDRLNDTLDTQLTGSIVEDDTVRVKTYGTTSIETIDDDSVIIKPGSYESFAFEHEGENEDWFLVIMNKDWEAKTTIAPWTGKSSIKHGSLYPKRKSESSTSDRNPAKSLFVESGDYNDLRDAYPYRQRNDGRIYVTNKSDDDATCTVKLMRVWRPSL